jgi:hypothetical protein
VEERAGKLQIPSTKLQASSKPQAPRTMQAAN